MPRWALLLLATIWTGAALGQSGETPGGFRPPPTLAGIPDESGFGGFLMLGAGVNRVKSNLIAGNDFGDVGKKEIDSIDDKPDGKTRAFPVVNFNLHYPFAESRTQLFVGNRLEDFIRYDLTTQIGARKEFSGAGIIGASLVLSTFPTEVWKDPYVEDKNRDETDRTSHGVRLNWQRMFGTPFRLQYTYRDIEVDNERSGETFLNLSRDEAKRLRRDGTSHSVEGFYSFRLAERHGLSPTLSYEREDLDGSAMSNDRYGVQLTHVYTGKRFAFVTNMAYEHVDFDQRNPIYDKTRDDDSIGVSFTTFYDRLFGARKWIGVGGITYYKNFSNIDFYEASFLQGFVAAMYRF